MVPTSHSGTGIIHYVNKGSLTGSSQFQIYLHGSALLYPFSCKTVALAQQALHGGEGESGEPKNNNNKVFGQRTGYCLMLCKATKMAVLQYTFGSDTGKVMRGWEVEGGRGVGKEIGK
ncbi:hypothetical protein PoB_001953300 [Plakobranchus ocellatus]|uniref:Uncharacterized protein n=1 Tax=Plakobranchus ocellatus TaxID=259542 RepID=A0AAV3ZEM4_9GAST|nr:hypothetical protein PoB_001953300 [Plakobranchus ocellatus]